MTPPPQANGAQETKFQFRSADLPKLDLDTMKGSDVTSWHRRWKAYRRLSGLQNEDAESQLEVLFLCLSNNSITILETLAPNVASVEEAVKHILEYAKGAINVIVERKKLFERRQRQGEAVQDFLMALKAQVKNCNYCNAECEDNNVATAFVIGLHDPHSVEAALTIKKPTLAAIVEVASAREAAALGRQRVQRREPEEGNQADEVQIARINNGNHFNNNKKKIKKTKPPCPWCASPLIRHTRETCPASSATCEACGKRGHIGQACKTNPPRGPDEQLGGAAGGRQQLPPWQQQPAARQLSVMTSSQGLQQRVAQPQAHFPQQQQMMYCTTDDEWLASPNNFAVQVQAVSGGCGQPRIEKAPPINLQCSYGQGCKHTILAMRDTGADVSAVGPAFLEQMGIKREDVKQTEIRPTAADGTVMKGFIGWITVTWTHGNRAISDDVFVFEGTPTPLLAWRVVRDLHLMECEMDPLVGAVQDANDASVHSLKSALLEEFKDVFSTDIKVMKGEKFNIVLEDGAKPFCLQTPRQVPIPMREPLRQELIALQKKGIIEPVTEVTDWCSPIVLEPKQSGGVRVCVDLTQLNRYVKRERYQSDAPNVTIADIPHSSKYFTTVDATKGYHQLPLAEECRNYTTFITPFGRYRYLRAPFGICSISEHYNRRMDEALYGLEHQKRTVDDILLHDATVHDSYHRVRKLLLRCRDMKITLAPAKFRFAEKTVVFAGFQLTQGKYRIDPNITRAIANFPAPHNISQLRSFFGLVNQIAFADPQMAPLMTPLRPLLSTKNEFLWDTTVQAAFEEARRRLASSPSVAFYQLGRPMRISTDASRKGLGFVLQQQSHEGHWKVIQAGSRMLSPAETRYAIIELEMLATCFAVKRSDLFIRGAKGPVVLMTDHKPLVTIINSKRLDEIQNPRLQRLKQFLMPYSVHATYVPGKENAAADALSRAPVDGPPPITAISGIHLRPQDDLRCSELYRMADADPKYKKLISVIREGFPVHKNQLWEPLRPFWLVKDELSVHEEIAFYGNRVVIPGSMQRQVLQQLHSSHQGVKRTQERARQSVYWPGIDREIQNVVEACVQCQSTLPMNPKQPMRQHKRPSRPGQQAAADFFEIRGMQFLVVTDTFTGWIEVEAVPEPNAQAVITLLDNIWSRMGLPEEIMTDGGPQFTALAMRQFLSQKRVRHTISAPTYPQSNGFAEAAVKTAKKLIMKCFDVEGRVVKAKLAEGLRQLRNTPSVRDGLTPAQKLYGRPIVDETTFHHRVISQVTEEQKQQAAARAEEQDRATKQRYDMTSRPLTDLPIGSRVLIYNNQKKCFDSRAIVLGVEGRQYQLRTAKGTLTRDRVHLRPAPEEHPPQRAKTQRSHDANRSLGYRLHVRPQTSTPAAPRPDRLLGGESPPQRDTQLAETAASPANTEGQQQGSEPRTSPEGNAENSEQEMSQNAPQAGSFMSSLKAAIDNTVNQGFIAPLMRQVVDVESVENNIDRDQTKDKDAQQLRRSTRQKSKPKRFTDSLDD